MQKLPKIARERLAAGPASGTHLDENLVTAFAEHALLPSERQRVIAHMAVCKQCRAEVQLLLRVSHAEGEPEAARATPSEGSAWSGFSWQRWLRWQPVTAVAALAAISVAFWVATRYPAPTRSRTAPSTQAAPPASKSVTMARNAAPPSPPARSSQRSTVAQSPTANKEAKKQLGISLRDEQGALAEARAQAHGRLVSGESPTPEVPQAAAQETVVVAAPPPPAPAVRAAGAPVSQSTGAALPAGNVAGRPQSARLQGVASAAGVSAKTRSLGKAMMAPRHAAQLAAPLAVLWAVNPDLAGSKPKQAAVAGQANQGTVGRSIDGGRTWQPVLVADGVTFRVVFAVGNDVWAGGVSGAFFHSGDVGEHWSAVSLPLAANDGATVGDIDSIQFADATHGDVSASTGQKWTTSDGGATWQEIH
jgi:Putative zinc-finger